MIAALTNDQCSSISLLVKPTKSLLYEHFAIIILVLNDLREELHATRKAWNIKEGNCPCCPGGRPILEEILKEEVKEEKVEMENKSENSQSSNIQPVCAGDQSTGGISAAVKTEGLFDVFIETITKITVTCGQAVEIHMIKHSSSACLDEYINCFTVFIKFENLASLYLNFIVKP